MARLNIPIGGRLVDGESWIHAGEKIEPDEVIPASAAGADDDQLARATAWLQSQPACGRDP